MDKQAIIDQARIRAVILQLYCMGKAPSTIVRRLREFGVMPKVTKGLIKEAHEVLMERKSPSAYYKEGV